MRCVVLLGAFIDWFQAVGTFGAVVAAVGIAVWGVHRERRQRPSLTLAFDTSLQPPDFMAGMWSGDGVDWYESHWVRLRVQNAAGRKSADDVEVLLREVQSLDEAADVRTLDVCPLRWSSTQGPADGALTRITIPPGLARHVDLLAIDGSGAGSAAEPTEPVAALQVWPRPTDNRHLLPAGRYVLHLAVVARDTDATFFDLEVSVPGEHLNAEDVRKHLQVSTPVKRPTIRRRP